MKVHVWEDERWPDYGLTVDPWPAAPTIEVSAEFLERYGRVRKEYSDLAEELRKLLIAQYKQAQEERKAPPSVT